MEILVLGGNGWLGALVAERGVAAGHHVTCLSRGRRGATPSGAHHVHGDRSESNGYRGVTTREWDEVVDVTWQPGFARSAVAALGDRARHWTYVSSCAVYANHTVPVARLDAPTVTAYAGDTARDPDYGPAKVACEDAVREGLGDRAAILRSGLLVGPGDVSDRFGYWVARMAACPDGPIVVPAADSAPVQYLDARDLASWMLTLAPDGFSGTLDAVGDTAPLRRIIDVSSTITGYSGELVKASDEQLDRIGVRPWFGPRSLPLWQPPDYDPGFARGDASAARSAGLIPRPLDDTLRDTLSDERQRGLERPRRAGLTRDDELLIVAELRANP